MAEAITNHFSGGAVRAFSAGVEPMKAVPKIVRHVLEERGINTEGLRTRSLESLQGPLAPKFDYVISLCNRNLGESCPNWRGQPVRANWNIPSPRAIKDPAQLQAEVEEIYNIIFRCVNAFLNLPVEVMESFSVDGKQEADAEAHYRALFAAMAST